eukprot:COSAG02_NODE_8725_length_2462_cov_1.635633_2_plen_623_part_00
MAAELVTQLRGGVDEREAAYGELLRREVELNTSTAGFFSITPAVREEKRSALRGMKLMALRARAMEELDEDIVESTMDAHEPKAALIELLLARPQSAEEKAVADIAVACASPLCEILCKPVAEVSVAEFHRALQVLTALSAVAPVRVGGVCWKPGQYSLWSAYTAPDSALAVMLKKEPAALTLEDAMTAAMAVAPQWLHWATSKGGDATIQAAGLDSSDTFKFLADTWQPAQFMLHVNATGAADDRNLALVPLLLELLKGWEKLPEFMMCGAFFALGQGVMARPAVATKLLELDAIAVLADILRQASPDEWVATAALARRPHGSALWCIKEINEAAQQTGIDLTAQLLSCGVIDSIISALSAVEQVGAVDVNALVVIWGPLMLLTTLGGVALGQIEDKLRTIPTALRYVKDSGLSNLVASGSAANVSGTIVAANLFGKDEDNTFGFSQDDIDGFIAFNVEIVACAVWGGMLSLAANTGRGILNLCISDAAKQMLLNNSGFIPHLVDGLLLDAEHARNRDPPVGAPQAIKAVVQRDFAECIQQLSLFPPGCDALKAATGVVTALHALIGEAWTEEAKDCARGALMQLTGQHVGVVVDTDALHIMVSCACKLLERSPSRVFLCR